MLINPSDIKITTKKEAGNYGEFVIEPLPKGFGYTLGNSLKRVLLTSLEGSAISQIKIAGVDHQFTTIEGVKEDVVEITLNLKKVRFVNHSKEPVAASLNIKGAGKVTAGDIESSSDLEVINKDQLICTLSDKKVNFKAELIVEKSVGYSPMEDRQSNKIGVIVLDALYSPVIKVHFTIEPTRFGKVTDLDKINLTVETDGSVKPVDAVEKSSKILAEYFAKLSNWDNLDMESNEEEVKEPKKIKGNENVAVEELPLPTRTVNALKKQGINTLQELAEKSDDDLQDIKNLGEKSVNEIRKLLKKEGLRQ